MKYLYILYFLLTSNLALSQTSGVISGRIQSPEGTPIEFVNVSLKGTSKGAVTARDGSFQLKEIAPGSYTLVASLVGFELYEKLISINPGEMMHVDISLREATQRLGEVTISGTNDSYNMGEVSSSLRLLTPLLETPQNIQVVTREVLEDQQVISMSDGLIRNVSGAVRLEHWGDLYTNISARGSQIQAFRNGFNVVNSYWGPLTEDMSFVDHVEFVKGPAGFMLAIGDPSGLYNVVTKKPTGQTKGEVSLTVGSFDLYRTALDLDGKLNESGTLLYRLNLAAQNKKSHRANEFNNRYILAPVISYQLDEKTLLTAEYIYQLAKMSDVGSFYVFSNEGFATLPVDFTSLPLGMPTTTIHDHSFNLNLKHQISHNWKVTGQLAHFRYDQQGTSLWPLAVNPDGTMIRGVSIWDAESNMTMAQVFVNGDFHTRNMRHRILGGVDLSNKEYFADWEQSHQLDSIGAEFNSRDPFLGAPVNGYPRFDRSTPLRARSVGGTIEQRYTAVYLQDELGFLENKIRLTLAGRYTDVEQAAYGAEPETAEHFTPRAGLSVSLNTQTSVYALYDQAFIPQAGIRANGEDVKPITGNNIEFGVKRNWMNDEWTSSLTLYRILKNNELTADPASPPASGLSVELGQKRSQGIEFDVRGSVTDGLNLIANYAYTDSKVVEVAEGITDIDEGDVVPGYAKHIVNTWLSYKIKHGKLTGLGFSAGLTWLSGRETYWETSPDPDQVLPEYYKLDAGLFWEVEKLKVTTNLFNVLDEYLYSGSYYSWLESYNWQTESPRNARLTVSYIF